MKQLKNYLALGRALPADFRLPPEAVTRVGIYDKLNISSMQHKKICIFGSANADYFLYVKKIPARGETIQSLRYMTANGGKGANQAVAAGKLAGSSTFIGQAGNDDAMKRLKTEMESAHVELHWKLLENEPTGMAYIYVDEEGENSIVIHGGANMAFDSLTELDPHFRQVIEQSDYLLLQKEIPMELVLVAAKYAHGLGKVVILDCGGRDDPISDELLDNITYLSPNETELERIDETIKITKDLHIDEIATELRQKLLAKHPNLKVLLKLGSKGSAIVTSTVQVRGDVVTAINPAVLEEYKIIDTVGAGDCFTAAFAVRHSELDWSSADSHADNYRAAMEFGNSSAFLCITKSGAMPSMPWRKDVDAFIQKYNIK